MRAKDTGVATVFHRGVLSVLCRLSKPKLNTLQTFCCSFYKHVIVDNNCAPGAATWRTRRSTALFLILAHWRHYVKTTSSTSKYRIALSPRKDRATATVNMYRKFRHVVFDIYASRQTDRQTYIHADHNTLHPYLM